MFLRSIKRLVTVIFICVCGLSAKSQQVHFLYLQTENGQHFYVKFNNKVYSSSTAGYMILAKLLDGDFSLSVGFPKNEFPEESFQISINNKNEGFLLKNFNEKGWGLFNMVNYNVLMGTGSSVVTAPSTSQNLQNDPFSKMLANVVKDSTILQKNEPEKPVAVVVNNDTTDLKKDTLVTAKGNALGNENALPITLKTDSTGDQNQADLIAKTNSEKASKTDSTLTAPGDQKPDITYGDVIKKAPITEPEKQPLVFTPAKKYMSKKGSDGMEMIYIDPNQDENDTVRIFIPSEKIVIKPAADNNSVVHNENPVYPLQDTSASVKSAAIEQPKEISSNTNDTTTSLSSLNFIENINSIKNKEGGLEKKDDAMNPMIDHENSGVKQPETKNDFQKNNIVVLPQVVQSSTTNSDCKAFANNEDFLRLRKKMASENNDDQMIKIAKKYFHTKCFSIEQIKNLSFLFLSNEGKYRFFDVAYPFSSDSEQYKMLQSQLTDSYYINRFKAMIHK
jgi:hypothetical protein